MLTLSTYVSGAKLLAKIRAARGPRQPVTVVVVLDVSESMKESLGLCLDSVRFLIEECFEPEDTLSLVTFSTGANIQLGRVPMDSRGRKTALRILEKLEAEGNTNLEAGLDLGLSLLDSTRLSCLLVLSDGVPNEGTLKTGAELAGFLAEGLRELDKKPAVCTMAYGERANAQILAMLATAGEGIMVSVKNRSDVSAAFFSVVQGVFETVALDLSLVVQRPGHADAETHFATLQAGEERNVCLEGTALQASLSYVCPTTGSIIIVIGAPVDDAAEVEAHHLRIFVLGLLDKASKADTSRAREFCAQALEALQGQQHPALLALARDCVQVQESTGTAETWELGGEALASATFSQHSLERFPNSSDASLRKHLDDLKVDAKKQRV